MGNEEESYGYAVVLGLCDNSCQCSRIYRILGCPWTSYKVVYSKVEEIIKQQNRFISCIKKSSLPFAVNCSFYILLISACIIFPTNEAKLSSDFTFTKLRPKIF